MYNEYCRYLLSALIVVPITCTATYVTVYGLIENKRLRKNKVLFWTAFLATVLIFALIRRSFNYFYLYPRFAPDAVAFAPYLFLPKLLFEAVNTYLFVAVYTMVYFMQAWYEQQRVSQALQKDKTEAQLELLKSQVQPHFIFNTLNNIYSLSIQNLPRTSNLILRLSSLLSYTLYDSKEPAVPFSKEFEYLENYIELEKVRYDGQLDVSINQYSNVGNFMISPLLLLPLVENCFKHGLTQNDQPSWIRLDVTIQSDWLTIKIENSKGSNGEAAAAPRCGIGLENVKRRLEILYPGKHEFRIYDEANSFLAVLKIKNFFFENSMPHSR